MRRRRSALLLRLSGMAGMTFLNPLLCVLAMNFANPSLLAPFSGLTLVWIVLLSERFLGERPSPAQVGGCSLILIGETLVSAFGDHSTDDDVTIDEVLGAYSDPAFLTYLAGMAAWMVALGCIMASSPPSSSSSSRSYSRSSSLHRFAWGASGGSITGLQNFLKDSLTVLKQRGATGTTGWFLPFVSLLSAAMLTALSGLLLLTACMRRYDATYSASAFVGSFVISASLMCLVRYDTLSQLNSLTSLVMYPMGLAVLTVGVGVLVFTAKEEGGGGREGGEGRGRYGPIGDRDERGEDRPSSPPTTRGADGHRDRGNDDGDRPPSSSSPSSDVAAIEIVSAA